MTTAIDPVPQYATGRPFIWYEPHQDDWALWFPKGIGHHVLAGRDVHAVSATDGSTSKILKALNGEISNGWWGGLHYPIREKIWRGPIGPDDEYLPLTPADLRDARDRELVNACAQIGIRPENVHLELATRTANITVAEAEALMLRYEALYPGAGHYTMHWADPDPNHAALGQALRNLATHPDPAKRLTDCRWIVRTSEVGNVPGVVEYVVPSTYQAATFHMARCVAKCFGAWAPDPNPEPAENKSLYGIGQHSVAADFAAVGSGRSEWIVKTP